MSKQYKKNQQPDILQTIVISIGKILWWLISLPFKGFKFGGDKSGLSVQDRNYITAKRLEIESLLNSTSEIELRHAVMEADKLVDYAMKKQGYMGETFADRMRSAGSRLPQNINNDIWSGHKVRNQIAHEQGIKISSFELKRAVENLLKYLKIGA